MPKTELRNLFWGDGTLGERAEASCMLNWFTLAAMDGIKSCHISIDMRLGPFEICKAMDILLKS